MPGIGPRERYTTTAIALHWLVAALVVGMLALGTWMTALPLSPLRLRLTQWHKWAGAAVLALTLLRLLWRWWHRPPAPPPMPTWQRRAAAASHAALYLLCLAVPLAGWAYGSASGFPLVLFGVLTLPDWVPVDRALAEAIKPWHGGLAAALGVLAVLHAAAAVKHQWIDGDGLLSRMVPGHGRGAR